MLPPDQPVLDAVPGHWVDRYAPLPWRPFLRLARLDRPIGWQLLLLPCLWSAALAAIAAHRPFPDLWHCLLFMVGAIAMRGAGSTYNDIIDRDLDAQVTRTKSRPLPSGQVSARTALVFAGVQALIGLAVLLQFNAFSIPLGMASLIPVAAYPFMKRIMPLPQVVLGLAFAWGALMGWAAVFGRLDAPALLLYAGAFAWVIGYDTIYALQDIEDDELAGIKSSARFFGEYTLAFICLCYSLAVLAIASSLLLVQAGLFSYGGLAAFAAHSLWQVCRLRSDASAPALSLFRSTRYAGALLFAGLCLDAFTSFTRYDYF